MASEPKTLSAEALRRVNCAPIINGGHKTTPPTGCPTWMLGYVVIGEVALELRPFYEVAAQLEEAIDAAMQQYMNARPKSKGYRLAKVEKLEALYNEITDWADKALFSIFPDENDMQIHTNWRVAVRRSLFQYLKFQLLG